MKNKFKRKMVLLSMISIIMLNIVACTSNSNKNYTKNENELIDFANNQISKSYNVDINKDEFGYSVVKQVEENKFEDLGENDKPEIVAVTAYKLDKPKSGEVLNYIFMYNTQTNEIISKEIEIN